LIVGNVSEETDVFLFKVVTLKMDDSYRSEELVTTASVFKLETLVAGQRAGGSESLTQGPS
jgi:hypothetical protein